MATDELRLGQVKLAFQRALWGIVIPELRGVAARIEFPGVGKEGNGDRIMADQVMGDSPRLDAVYGEGEWAKMRYVLRGNESNLTTTNVTVHWFRNLDTGMNVEYELK